MKTLFERKKLYAVIIVTVFIIVFFITFNIIRNHYQFAIKDTINENKSTANLLSSLIYEYQKAAISILESYAQRPTFIDAVKKKDFNHVIPHLQSLRKNHTEIDALFITDPSGTLWANYPVDRTGFGKNMAYRDWYKGVSKNWQPYISTLYKRVVLEKGLAVAVSVPVFDSKGNVIGILSAAERAAFMATFIKEKMIDPEKGITLLDQEGNIIFSNAVPYEEKITKYPDAHVLEKTVAGVTANVEIADAKERGSISCVSIAPVKGVGWSVIIGQRKDTILKPLYGYFILSAVTGIVIFLLITVGMLYFRREYIYRKTKEFLQAEEKYHSIFENALEGIYQSTPEGRFISVNPALARMLGYDSPEELIGGVTDIAKELYVDPGQRAKVVNILDEHCFVQAYEVQLYRKDRSIIWLSLNTRAVKDEKENLLYIEGMAEDITERKRAEAELRDSEALYRNLFENHSAVKLIIDPDTGNIVDVNEAAVNYYGWSHERLQQMKIQDINTFSPEKIKEEMEKARTKKRIHFEFRHKRADGSIRDVEVFSSKIEVKGKDLLHSIIHDITDRKQAEHELSESEKRYRILFNTIDEGFCIIEVIFDENEKPIDYRFLDINPSFEKQTGLIDAQGKRMRELAPKHEEHWFEIYGKIAVTGQPVRFVNRAEQLHRWYDVYAFRVGQPENRQVAILFNDITERKRQEEELRSTLKQLLEAKDMLVRSEKLSAIGQLAAGVAHEILNPINIMGVKLQALEMMETLSEKTKEAIRTCENQIKRVTRITRDLQQFARVSEKQITPSNINELIEQVFSLMRPRLKTEDVKVDARYQADLPLVPLDRDRMGQVILNLINNALDAMKGRPERVLRVITELTDKNVIRLSFSDTGTGIPPEILSRIFDPFFTTKEPGKGTGLGLSISYGIIQDHNGTIWAENNESGGATFFIELPV